MVFQYIHYIGHLGIGDYSTSLAFWFKGLQVVVVILSYVQQEMPIKCLMTGQHFLLNWLSQLLL